jgi:hypothetical protein
MLDGRVDVERQLFFFLIQRNQRRWMEDDLVSTRFLHFGGGSSYILRLFDPLLNHTIGVRRVRHGPAMREEMYKNRKRVKEESKEMVVFLVETVTGWIYPIWSGHVQPRSDMSDQSRMCPTWTNSNQKSS